MRSQECFFVSDFFDCFDYFGYFDYFDYNFADTQRQLLFVLKKYAVFIITKAENFVNKKSFAECKAFLEDETIEFSIRFWKVCER